MVIILSGCEIEINRSSEYEDETEADRQVKTLRQPVAICSEDAEFIDWQEDLLSENGYKPLRVMRNLQECLFLEKKAGRFCEVDTRRCILVKKISNKSFKFVPPAYWLHRTQPAAPLN